MKKSILRQTSAYHRNRWKILAQGSSIATIASALLLTASVAIAQSPPAATPKSLTQKTAPQKAATNKPATQSASKDRRKSTAVVAVRPALKSKLLAQASPAPAVTPGVTAQEKADFSLWLKDFRSEARVAGISEKTLKAALDDVSEPIPRVVELDRKQPESTITFDQYLERIVNTNRIERGRTLLLENQALLNAVSTQYNVPPQYIVALWGIETDYGRVTGGYSVVGALATLAFEGRRAQFFRTELLKALKIIDEGHITAGNMLGSWAGAMGQSQFMPSSFLSFAQDGNNDGRKDIWTTLPDVFASIANYLSSSGWKADRNWGEAVVLPTTLDRAGLDSKNRKPVADWISAGVTRSDGKRISFDPNVSAAIVLPGGPEGPAYLVTENYLVFLKWNRSLYFATAAGTLADRLVEAPQPDPYAAPPTSPVQTPAQ